MPLSSDSLSDSKFSQVFLQLGMKTEGRGIWNDEAKKTYKTRIDQRRELVVKFTGGGDFDFSKFIFPGNVTFEDCQFLGSVNFNDAQFLGKVRFSGCKFGGLTTFEKTKFRFDVIFSNTSFQETALFVNTSFGYVSIFDDVDFEQFVDFEDANFHDQATFFNVNFQNISRFNNAVFYSTASFQASTFSMAASFKGIKLHLDFDLKGAKFERAIELHDIIFDNPPDFNSVEFKIPPSLSAAEFKYPVGKGKFDWYFGKTTDKNVYLNFLRLKKLAADAQDHEKEIQIFAMETKAKRFHTLKPTNIKHLIAIFFSYLYQFTSNFGMSIFWPLFWLFAVSYFAANTFSSISKNHLSTFDPNVLLLTGSNVFSFVGISLEARKTSINALCGVQPNEVCSPDFLLNIYSISVIHGFFSLLFVFLFGLGLRNLFRIK